MATLMKPGGSLIKEFLSKLELGMDRVSHRDTTGARECVFKIKIMSVFVFQNLARNNTNTYISYENFPLLSKSIMTVGVDCHVQLMSFLYTYSHIISLDLRKSVMFEGLYLLNKLSDFDKEHICL